MNSAARVTFFHAPQTRSRGTLALFEELGVPYDLRILNLKQGEQRGADYLRVNPMGKVPAVVHGNALIAEQAAIFMYLADLYPQARLAPAIGDPLRGPYLRWMVFYGSCFEPALIDRAQQHTAPSPSTSPYGDYDTMLGTLLGQLETGPWLLGDTYTAADVLWGIALDWTSRFKLVPDLPVIRGYVDRVLARPAIARAYAKDAEQAAAQQPA